MLLFTSAHKQTDPAKAPGQIVNPVTRDAYKRMMFMHPYGVNADEKQLVSNIGTSNALGNDGIELEGSTCD